MTRWNEGSPAQYLSAELVLSQAEIGVIVADRDGNVVFANEHIARLLRLGGEEQALAGKPLGALGLIPDETPGKADELFRQVLSGITWEDTVTGRRSDGTLVFVREIAVPLPRPRHRRHRRHGGPGHRGRPQGCPAGARPAQAS